HPSTGERCVRVLPPGGGLSADRGTASPCMPALPLRAVARRAVEPAGGTSREHRGGACAGRRVPGGGGGHVDGGGSGGDAHHPRRGGYARSPYPRGGALSRTCANSTMVSLCGGGRIIIQWLRARPNSVRCAFRSGLARSSAISVSFTRRVDEPSIFRLTR